MFEKEFCFLKGRGNERNRSVRCEEMGGVVGECKNNGQTVGGKCRF